MHKFATSPNVYSEDISQKGGCCMTKLESKYQKELIKTLQDIFTGCIVVKNDPNYIQGIPDLLVLYNDKWAALECKRNSTSRHRPNQDYYIEKMENMSFAAFIYPENEAFVLNRLIRYFGLNDMRTGDNKEENGHDIQRPQETRRRSRNARCV